MHEMSICVSVLELIEEERRNHGFSRVKQVGLALGALGHVEPEAVRFCFDAVSRGSIAEGAALKLTVVPGEGWCERCRHTIPLAERYAPCPVCGSHVRVTAGEDLRLMELEVE
jgi:hydrogenase nickel incorporation protein HypA/HybF